MVVLGHDEDEGIDRVDSPAPVARVLMDIDAIDRLVRFVEERQVHLREIEHLDVEASVSDGTLDEPIGDVPAATTGPRAGYDDPQATHD